LNDMSRAMMSTDSVQVAMKTLAQAREIFQEHLILPMLADNFGSAAEAAMLAGEFDNSEAFARQGLEICETIGNLWNEAYITGTQMQIAQVRGQARKVSEYSRRIQKLAQSSGFYVSESIAKLVEANLIGDFGSFERALALCRASASNHEFTLMDAWRYGTVARLLTMKGDLQAAHEVIAEAHASMKPEDISNYGPIFVAMCSAELALKENRFEQTMTESEQLIELLNRTGVLMYMPPVLLLHARGVMGLATNLQPADASLERAEELARRMDARLVLWQILAARSELEHLRGDKSRSIAARIQARSIILSLAEEAPEDLQATFFARPEVQSVLREP
jgi:ATP/maltotriose-dependent transcriptional regulator MalT